jgi:hypothetical protein
MASSSSAEMISDPCFSFGLFIQNHRKVLGARVVTYIGQTLAVQAGKTIKH